MPADVRTSLPRTSSALVNTRASGWAPVLAAMAIDLADFAMMGPLGLVAGLFVGFALTFVLTSATGAPTKRALLLGLLGGVYCMLPITDLVPLATMLTLLHGALLRRRDPVEVQAIEGQPVEARSLAR
jgi:ammonia channel protein AmtB